MERADSSEARRPLRRGERRGGPRASSAPQGAEVARVYGLHAATEALRNPRRKIIRVLATDNALRRLGEETRLTVEPQIVDPREIDRLLPQDAVHQGFLVEALPLIPPELDEVEADGIVLALDQITDPHNVGALEHVPLVPVRNLAEALIRLGERGFQRVGLDSAGEGTLEAARLSRPLLLALGAEGKGLRERVRSCCDLMLRIDLPGAIKSLNVSNAAAIALSLAHGKLAHRS
jgi:23S rRNA (guanosine2251-2'-O)-methyltransferase